MRRKDLRWSLGGGFVCTIEMLRLRIQTRSRKPCVFWMKQLRPLVEEWVDLCNIYRVKNLFVIKFRLYSSVLLLV